MKGVETFDKFGWWHYRTGNYSVSTIDCKEYLFGSCGEGMSAVEVVDELSRLESQLTDAQALIEKLVETGEKACFDYDSFGYGYDGLIKPFSLPLEFDPDEFNDIVAEYRASKKESAE